LASQRQAERREQLLHMALGIFAGAGVARLELPTEGAMSTVADLVLNGLVELEAIAEEKGGVRLLLDEKWRRLYKTISPRGML